MIVRSGEERVYEVGSIDLVPHILLSSRRHFRKVGLVGSRVSSAYDNVSGERRRET